MNNLRHGLKVSLAMLSWVPVAVTINQTVGYVSWIQGSSMKPALNPDESLGWRDLVVMAHQSAKQKAHLHIGDVVMVRSPQDPDKVLVKRIIGVGGDNISTSGSYPKSTVTVPPNHYWLEGDNSSHSIDSNVFGPVSSGMVIGKATYVIFPFSRWGAVSGGGREARVDLLEDEGDGSGR